MLTIVPHLWCIIWTYILLFNLVQLIICQLGDLNPIIAFHTDDDCNNVLYNIKSSDTYNKLTCEYARFYVSCNIKIQ